MKWAFVAILLIAIVGIASACPMDTGGHLVKFTVKTNGNLGGFSDYVPVTNATITATPYYDNNDFWFLSMFGITPESTNNLIVENVSGITDDYGVTVLPLYSAARYKIAVANASCVLYPNDDDYVIYMR